MTPTPVSISSLSDAHFSFLGNHGVKLCDRCKAKGWSFRVWPERLELVTIFAVSTPCFGFSKLVLPVRMLTYSCCSRQESYWHNHSGSTDLLSPSWFATVAPLSSWLIMSSPMLFSFSGSQLWSFKITSLEFLLDKAFISWVGSQARGRLLLHSNALPGPPFAPEFTAISDSFWILE